MYKTIKIALIAMLLSVLLPTQSWATPAVPEHTESFYVNDYANVIDIKAENYMVNYGVRLHQETGAQVVLVTVDSTGGASMEEYATTLFNSWGIGSADKNNGVLLLLSIEDDDYWALQGDGLKSTLTDSILSQILAESLEPDFAQQDYAVGARKTYGAIIEQLGGVWIEPFGGKEYVADNAGVLPQITRLYLNQSSNRYKTTTGSGVYIVTVKNPGDMSLQEYTYAKFASVVAGSRDVMLVLDIEGDNYHVLQGKDVDTILTNEWIGGILDEVLEPQFADKNYAAGATATANAFYSFFLARADYSPESDTSASSPAASAVTSYSTSSGSSTKATASSSTYKPPSMGKGLLVIAIFLFVIVSISRSASRRNQGMYGQPVHPYRQSHRPQHRPEPVRRSEPSPKPSSFWGTNHGGGGTSSGGGAGRHSSSSSGSKSNHGGGGTSSGGGSGRHSSSSGSGSGSGRYSSSSSGRSSSSGGSSGGGGSASGGGGVGRHR